MNTEEQEELREQIHLFIKKARRSVAAARRLLNDKDVDFAISRLYYAVFYGMEAVLLTKNITSAKHAGVISQFNQLFVKEGIFPKHFSKSISRLFRERQESDYGCYIDINETEMHESLNLAEVEAFLKKEQFL